MDTQENQNFWNEAENELRKAGETTIVDFFKELLPSEYELEYLRHKQEHENILQKLKYRVTIESKKKALDNELDLTIQYLEDEEEGEFRQIFGDLSQVTLDQVISKIKMVASLIQSSSLWHEMSHIEKTTFLTIRNLKIDLIKADTPFIVAYREILKRLNIRVITEQNKRVKPVTINRQLKEFVNKLFYDHFQVELNKALQEELKKIIPVSEIEIQEPKTLPTESPKIENEDTEKSLTIPIKVKGVKKGREIDLEQDAYAIITHYFQKARIFLSQQPTHITDVTASKAMQILSGYHYDNIRKKLGNLEFTNNQRVVVKEKLEEVIGLINRDLAKK